MKIVDNLLSTALINKSTGLIITIIYIKKGINEK
jgi:hypothetical protein